MPRLSPSVPVTPKESPHTKETLSKQIQLPKGVFGLQTPPLASFPDTVAFFLWKRSSSRSLLRPVSLLSILGTPLKDTSLKPSTECLPAGDGGLLESGHLSCRACAPSFFLLWIYVQFLDVLYDKAVFSVYVA
ncbi:UNVERIFIED_CONTAM: hypothetical protein K2H54_008719 [Gekko kuhli]